MTEMHKQKMNKICLHPLIIFPQKYQGKKDIYRDCDLILKIITKMFQEEKLQTNK